MGSGVSKNLLDYGYQAQRTDLRRNLILAVIENPENKELLEKITTLRAILIEHTDICATAARELEKKYEYSPTSAEAAQRELERLYSIYETSRILKSVQCRTSSTACPLAHNMTSFENSSDSFSCNICKAKNILTGFHCGYCYYSLCMPCSFMYCANGHAMKLWTHPESQHTCALCKASPITSGYRCLECDEEFDVCDYCTYYPGRQMIQDVIHARMAVIMKYMTNHVLESATALRVSNTYKKMIAENSYPTTLLLFEFSLTLKMEQDVARVEVHQTRVGVEINRLRAIITIGVQHSATAARESKITGRYCDDELRRLNDLVEASEHAKSQLCRSSCVVACPLGHATLRYCGVPTLYVLRDNKSPLDYRHCKVCDRIAQDGFHCELCEYELCVTCSEVYCDTGHLMKLWTEPEACDSMCFVCQARNLTRGYHCNSCNTDMCDECTAKAGRDALRVKWDREMRDILDYLRDNRRFSDVAQYYHWRNKNYVVSNGLLVEYVVELRIAKARAAKQVKYKTIIDKIKTLRRDLSFHSEICKQAADESSRDTNYFFTSQKQAQAELNRLESLARRRALLQTIEVRARAGIACPLAHAMIPILESPQLEIVTNSTDIENQMMNLQQNLPHVVVDEQRDQAEQAVDVKDVDGTHSTLHNAFKNKTEDRGEIARQLLEKLLRGRYRGEAPVCRACSRSALRGGHSCFICDYDICQSCSSVYCRLGHPMRIWTLPEAVDTACDVCRTQPITSGYRCLTCGCDICDMCTLKDGRDSLKLWPRRELNKLIVYLDSVKLQSQVAQEYLARYNGDTQRLYMLCMTSLCDEVAVYRHGKQLVDDELAALKLLEDQRRYGLYSNDA